ncbi:MAG: beta-aspartyl-peptidase [Sarcina sp.]
MIKLIKNVEIYSPDYLGLKDILIANNKIVGIYDNFIIGEDICNIINIIDGIGKIAVPGFIDSHVHIIGGGGEGGFKTRTPEITLESIIDGGVTTIVGCLGTDGICRDMRALLAKVYSLEQQGINSYCYTGSYEFPIKKTLTNSVKEDIVLIEKIIGVGEIALSDHRSSQGSFQDFVNLVAQARVAGLLAGKSGIVNVHLGAGARMMDYIFRLFDETEIPPDQILPTHINRNSKLLNEGLKLINKGGYVDLTTSSNPDYLEEDEYRAADALIYLLENKADISRITFSSDANGSMPVFDENGILIGIGIGLVSTLFREVKYAITKGVKMDDALRVITTNPATVLGLKTKGIIAKNMDADVILLDKNLEIDTVISNGKILKKNKVNIIKGFFE